MKPLAWTYLSLGAIFGLLLIELLSSFGVFGQHIEWSPVVASLLMGWWGVLVWNFFQIRKQIHLAPVDGVDTKEKVDLHKRVSKHLISLGLGGAFLLLMVLTGFLAQRGWLASYHQSFGMIGVVVLVHTLTKTLNVSMRLRSHWVDASREMEGNKHGES
ncbi:MAG: hypothetical protein R3A11_06420 [Bdellovibrionota bacterium]